MNRYETMHWFSSSKTTLIGGALPEWLGHPRLRLLHVRSGDGALGCLNDRFDSSCWIMTSTRIIRWIRGTVDGASGHRLVQSNVNPGRHHHSLGQSGGTQ